MVVMCSQHGNRGPSICNGHEFYREQLTRLLRGNRGLSGIAKLTRENLGSMDGFLKPAAVTIVDVLLQRWCGKDIHSRFDGNTYWFEHWPAHRTTSKREEFWEVTLDEEDNDKTEFSETTIENIAVVTGYAAEQLRFRFRLSQGNWYSV